MNIFTCKQITFYSYFTLVKKGIARRAVLGKKTIIILVIITITVLVGNDQIITYIHIYNRCYSVINKEYKCIIICKLESRNSLNMPNNSAT